MAELTPEQQKALALARARLRLQDSSPDVPRETPDQPAVVPDVARSGGAGIWRGLSMLGGLPGDVTGLVNKGGNYLYDAAHDALLGPRSPEDQAALDAARANLPKPYPTTPSLIGAVDALTGGAASYEPQTKAGEYARTIGEFLPGAMTMAGEAVGPARAALQYGVAPAVASQAAGDIPGIKGTPLEAYARTAGAIAAPLGVDALKRAVSPFPATPERAAAAKALADEGVSDLTAGQISGNRKLKYIESEMGGARVADMLENQGTGFTKAVLRKAGIDAERATPEVLDNAFNRIGGEFDRLAANNSLALDAPVLRKINDALDGYEAITNPSYRAPIVGKVAGDLADAVRAATQQGGTAILDGGTYQNIRSMLGKSAKALRISNPEGAQALREIQDALDGAMERSLAANNPADLNAWRLARQQYKNMLVIEKAATGAGDVASSGIIKPANLRAAAKSTLGVRSYARGKGDFDSLARAGEMLMTPMPDSGTASRTAVRNLISLGPTALGYGAGSTLGGYPGGILGGVIGAAAPTIAGRTILSAPVRAYLANNLIPRSPRTVEELIASLYGGTTPLRLPSQ